jgi:hypothetical protein
MRAALLTRALPCGRRSRVVLTPRRWRQVSQRQLREATVARKPGHRGARNKLLKPLRAGMPGDPGATVVTNARAYYSTRAAAGRAPGIPRSPLGVAPRPLWAKNTCNNSDASRREMAEAYICVPRMLRSAPLLRRDVLLIRGPCSASCACGSRLCGAS